MSDQEPFIPEQPSLAQRFPKLWSAAQKLDQQNIRIEQVHVRCWQVEAQRDFSFGTWTSRQLAEIVICAQDQRGFGENIIATNQPEEDGHTWHEAGQQLSGLSFSEALNALVEHPNGWPHRSQEAFEMALVDLIGKLGGVSALELLGLMPSEKARGTADYRVPTLSVILSRDLARVRHDLQEAMAEKRAHHVKLKLFGEAELDQSIVRQVRQDLGDASCWLIGDVNQGYKAADPSRAAASQAPLVEAIAALHQAGLDAVEDPCPGTIDEILAVEDAVNAHLGLPESAFPFIFDAPMRPARRAKALMLAQGEHRCFINHHPGCMGSIFDAIELAQTAKSRGERIMIGDDSLIGAACTVWQQLAIGLGAEVCEATTKPGDSDRFLGRVRSLACREEEGWAIWTPAPGFGLDLEVDLPTQ